MTINFQAQCEHQVKQSKEPLSRRVDRSSLRTLTLVIAVSALGLLGCAQTSTAPTANAAQPMAASGMPMGGQDSAMAQMDTHMKMMRETHDKMMQAKSPEERKTLMATHMKQMQDGMAGMQAKSPMTGDLAARQQMTEKRVEMMQSMMQMMMMDRMPQAPSKQ